MDHDFEVNDQGTIVLITPISEAAIAHFEERIPEEAMHMGQAVVCDHRCGHSIVEALIEEGFEVVPT